MTTKTIKEWDNYFLRDDTEIRKEDPELWDGQIEAYSLFRVNPYGRVSIFGGTRQWALQQSELIVRDKNQETASV